MINELRYNIHDFDNLDLDDMVIVLDGYVYPVHTNDYSQENIKICVNLLKKLCDKYHGITERIFNNDGSLRDVFKNNIGDAFWNFVDLPKILVGSIDEGQNGLVLNFMSNSYDIKNSKELFNFMKTGIQNNFDVISINDQPINVENLPKDKKDLKNVPLANPLYHGTCEKFLLGILTKGLRSNADNSAFSINNDGFVFMTSDYTVADEYANLYERKKRSNKCIIQINSNKINKNNIVLDYDFSVAFSDDYREAPYPITDKNRTNHFIGNVTSNSGEHGSKFAKLGYRGIVMPNAIEGVYVWEGNGYTYYNRNEYIENSKTNENMETIQKPLNEVESSEVNLSSFKIKDNLNPKFWVNDKLNSRVRLRLLDIADDFIDELAVDWVKPKDIVLTGSLANYNWSKYSDVDIHILMDYKKIYNKKEFVEDYFSDKKDLWAETHPDLKIYGYPVEIYVEDINATNYSTGIYSLNKNEWIKEPGDFQNAKINEKYIKEFSAKTMTEIDKLTERLSKAKTEGAADRITARMKKIFTKLKNMRSEGLKNGGEMSSGNIIWKVMRRTKYTDRLWDAINKSYDKTRSL